MKHLKGLLILLFTAIIWGFAFIVQGASVKLIPPFSINFLRSILACLFLCVVALVINRKNKRQQIIDNYDKNSTLKAGIFGGVVLAIAVNLQQIGLAYTTPGEAGVITALYIVFVPIFGIFLNRRVKINVWLSVVMALVGFCLMNLFDDTLEIKLGIGEILIFISAIFFALQIVVVDCFVKNANGLYVSIIQFLMICLICLIPMFIEKPNIDNIIQAIPDLIYLGVISSGIGYTLQIIGQKNINPTIASLILSLESVFALLFGMIILNQIPTLIEGVGALLIFFGVFFSQTNEFEFYKRKDKIC